MKKDSKLSSKRRTPLSTVFWTNFMLIRPRMPTMMPPWKLTTMNFVTNLLLMLLLSKLKLIPLLLLLRKVTDATTSATSKPDVTDSHERATHDHASHSHHHQRPHTSLSVSVNSRLTGTVPLTTVSEPALLKKRPVPSMTKPTSLKSEPRLKDTRATSPTRLSNGKDKLPPGKLLLLKALPLPSNV